jgi:Rps23 Pro-64 3,4-dihydroxylase Tpa1-like proline 4-hydroxylase
MSDPRVVAYAGGDALVPDVTPAHAVRAIAVLYFLHNGPWRPGDGGEMGLYASTSDPIDQPAVAVPPVDNSIVLFECTPHSLHGFIHNRRVPRSSMIMWVHRPRPDVVAQWSARSIVEWPGGKTAKKG